MSSRPKEVMWEAPSHTIAKIKMLQTYLTVYLLILARKLPGKPILFVDGFAGPDEYKNHPSGSPSAMLAAARDASRQLGISWTAGYLYCAFVEEDRARFTHLSKRLDDEQDNIPHTQIFKYNMRFDQAFEKIKQDIPESFNTNAPLFAFIDPFGAMGAPFSLIREILSSGTSEILLNFDADGIGRIINNKDGLDAIFGNNDWTLLFDQYKGQRLWQELVELYKMRLKSIPGVKYTFATEMRGSKDNLSYYLVFASGHKRGLVKMKEAMNSIVKDKSYVFSESKLHQGSLPLYDDIEAYAHQLHKHFCGKTENFDTVETWVLNETPFTSSSKILRVLDKEGKLSVVRLVNSKRASSWSKENIASLTFKQGGPISGSLFDY